MLAKLYRAGLAIVIAVGLALAGCSSDVPPPRMLGNPLAGQKLASGQAIHAISAERELRLAGKTDEADKIGKLAAQPTATWLNGDPDGQFDHVLVANILAATPIDETPVFVLYNLPHRDAGAGLSAGGAANAQAYKSWIQSITAELRDRRTIIIVEPDSIAAIAHHQLDNDSAKEERYVLIRYALKQLQAHPNSRAYLDAGNPGWTTPDDMAGLLKRAGVDAAQGIAVNVSNFYSDADNAAYGKRLSELLGGVGVVVDRGRNGNGPEQPQNRLSWCNPPGRAIGKPPEVGGRSDTINAWLWIKPPGDSDGNCRPGEPRAGLWWLDYALTLVKGT